MRMHYIVAVACLAIAGVALAEEAVTPTEKTMLWNGKDLEGWKWSRPNSPKTWSVKDGVIDCTGTPTGTLLTEKDYTSYKLHVEWRWADKPGNSGIFVHGVPYLIEIQLANKRAGDLAAMRGADFKEHRDLVAAAGRERAIVPMQGKSVEKPSGEWNSADIVCRGDSIIVRINGELKNIATECNVQFGKIGLQSEGGRIQFRNIYIEPLDD